MSLLVFKLSYCLTLSLCGSPSFVFFSLSFECKPQEVKVTICLNRHSKAFHFMGTGDVFTSFLPGGDRIFCSFVNILSELCSRQISLGQILERMGFQEGYLAQERAYWLMLFRFLFVAQFYSFSHLTPSKTDNDCFILLQVCVKVLLPISQ